MYEQKCHETKTEVCKYIPRSTGVECYGRKRKWVAKNVPLKVNIEHWAAKSHVMSDSILKQCGQVLSPEYSRVTSVVYTQEYPITLLKVELGQISKLNAHCWSV